MLSKIIGPVSRENSARIIKAIETLYPSEYADRRWDNTGLLIDCSTEKSDTKPRILLTVDLTKDVADEAIKKNCNFIIAYHPFIFGGWKNILPLKNTQHSSAMKLIQNNISVYCPHTAVDASINGVNDWIVKILTRGDFNKSIAIEKISNENDNIGYGRFVNLKNEVSIETLIQRVKLGFNVKNFLISKPNDENRMIKSIALCAGSGSGVFKSLKEDADLYFSGELSHHEVLKLKEEGKYVILVNHSNSERGFIQTVMRDELTRLLNDSTEIVVSETDTDPLVII